MAFDNVKLFDIIKLEMFGYREGAWKYNLSTPLEAATANGPEAQADEEEDAADKQEEGSEEEWEQVGPRNKTSITRQADFVSTPITDIFGGHIRYAEGFFLLNFTLDLNVFFALALNLYFKTFIAASGSEFQPQYTRHRHKPYCCLVRLAGLWTLGLQLFRISALVVRLWSPAWNVNRQQYMSATEDSKLVCVNL